MTMKSIAQSILGAYLLLDGGFKFAAEQVATYDENKASDTPTKARAAMTSAEANKASLIEAGVGAKLLHINWEKPIREAVNGPPKRRSSN